jgi:glyoxylase-like metal-dependent hydrolase (beta-lactamase superfamily II)
MKRLVSMLLCSLVVGPLGCGTLAPAGDPVPPPVARDRDREALEQAVRWPDPTVPVVMQLASRYLATHREEEGYRYFSERAQAVPGRPLFLALSGLFQVRMSWRVPLLRRVRWVDEGIAKLDRAAAVDPLSRYLRGLTFAELPARFGKSQQAVADLTEMLGHSAAFPPGLRRGAQRGIARARGEHTDLQPLLNDYSVSEADGFRFSPPAVEQPAPNVFLVRGYDFADLAFVVTGDGLIAIDAGTTEATARAALAALREHTKLPIKYLIVTHAHWDHVGGLRALLEPGTEVIAQARFADELAKANAAHVPFHFFFGRDARGPWELAPTRTIARPETLTLGGTRVALYPAAGGETEDALLVHLPDSGVLFVGDVLMPYFGAPFVAEGSPEGLFDTIALIERLHPKVLLHGHTPLTANFTVAAIGPLGEALREVHKQALADLTAGKTLPELLSRNLLPSVLERHPEAVLPFLLMHDNLIQRLHAQRSGYWQPDGEGMEVLSPQERGAALALVANEAQIARGAEELVKRGDYALALDLAKQGLAAHPESARLARARNDALDGLRTANQNNPFKFLIYSEMAGHELPPLR